MSNGSELDFGVKLEPIDRAALLDEAAYTVRALPSELGLESKGPDAASEAASKLLGEFKQEIARFSAFPDVYPLRQENFTQHGLTVPTRFQDASKDYNFYWLYFPMELFPLQHYPFSKLELAVEFNPGVAEGHLRPRAHKILPDRKFQDLVTLEDSLEIKIGENFEFEVSAEQMKVEVPGVGKAGIGGGVDVKLAGGLGLMVGPFKYTMKKAQIENSGVGTETVRWRVSGAQFFQGDDPAFIAVVQVPKQVQEVQIAAALRAFHTVNLGAMGLSEAFQYFTQRVKNFFNQGIPTSDEQVWDITPRLVA